MDFFKTAFLKDAGAIKLTIYNNHQSTFFFVKMFFHRQTFVLLYIVSKVAPLYIVYIYNYVIDFAINQWRKNLATKSIRCKTSPMPTVGSIDMKSSRLCEVVVELPESLMSKKMPS